MIGIDPTDRTFRELQHMADGKERSEWARVAALMLATNKSLTGAGPKLLDLIPERYRKNDDEDDDRTETDEAAESELAFAELESGLRALSRQIGPKIAGFTGG